MVEMVNVVILKRQQWQGLEPIFCGDDGGENVGVILDGFQILVLPDYEWPWDYFT